MEDPFQTETPPLVTSPKGPGSADPMVSGGTLTHFTADLILLMLAGRWWRLCGLERNEP